MTGWNYRIVKTLLKTSGVNYAVHEVSYDEFDHPVMMTVRGISPIGESPASFVECYEMWKVALKKPVLIFDDKQNKFVGEEPPIKIPVQTCDQCGREMVKRETWTCPIHGEDWE